MPNRVPIVQRAFELARSGSCCSVADVRKRLKGEGYASVNTEVQFSLARQLAALCRESQAPKANSGS